MTTTLSSETRPRVNYQEAPAVLSAMLALQQAVNDSGLEASLLMLVALRASQINGCAFCIDMHVREAREAGEPNERLYLLSAWREVDLYTPRERAALLWTETLTRLADNHVSDEIFARVKAEFSDAELTNLTLAIVAINGWNRFNAGFCTPPSLGN